MVYQKLIYNPNRYRKQITHFLQFPCKVDDLVVESYTRNNGQARTNILSVFNFSTITYLRTSEKGYYHCVGLIGSELYQLILKENGRKTN